jgi:PIN domain nuclease of toxin-antitoxin system
MELLLDTSTVLWAANESNRLSRTARRLLDDTANELIVSCVTIWEISVKWSAGKLRLPVEPERFSKDLETKLDVRFIGLSLEDVLHERSLPRIHKDPFDRILICQAISRDLIIVTPDRSIRQYSVPSIW